MSKQKNKNRITYDVIGIFLIILSFYFYICLFGGDSGVAGKYVKNTLRGVFGLGSYLFPLFLLVSGIGIFYLKDNIRLNIKFYSICIVFINLLLLLYLLNIKVFEDLADGYFKSIIKSYELGKDGIGGGIIGVVFGYFLNKYIGKTGTASIVTGVFIVSFILFANTSVKSVINSIKVYITNKFSSISNIKKKSVSINKQNSIELECENEDTKSIKRKIINFPKEFDKNFSREKEDSSIKSREGNSNNENLSSISNESNPINVSDNVTNTKIDLTSKSILEYSLPSTNLLFKPNIGKDKNIEKEIMKNIKILDETLESFNVDASVSQVSVGPSITRYELQLSPGVKVNKVVSLADNIALSLASEGIRIEAPIPGKAAVGIEVPNKKIKSVFIKELLDSKEFKDSKSKIAFALGKDVAGTNIIADISKMPHLLIAGATGSGKSVCINTVITSILFKANPDEVKMIMIDPKVVELSIYNGIPHLLIPVVTDPKKAASALNWAVQEMAERYKMFATKNVRDIDSYNKLEEDKAKMFPQIVIIIDELSDLMIVSPSEVEDAICRLAQMARAAGIYLIIATQRPSVDVITGLIKANVPSRISFAVSSQIDSRTILDASGAEKLLGKGDMLYFPSGESKPKRVQGTFISEKEIKKIVDYIKDQVLASYDEEVIESIQVKNDSTDIETDELFEEAINIVLNAGQASILMLQRKLRIGYNRAARIIDQMEEKGVIGGYEGSKPRKVLISENDWREMM